jgi:hypothetical protein
LRAPLALLAAAAAALLIAVAATAAPRTVTRRQAHAVAVALNLRAGDVPTLTAHANPLTSAEFASADQLAGCYGGVPMSNAFAVAQSPNFEGTSVSVSSLTEILATPALVAKDLAAAEGSKAVRCLLGQFKAAAHATGALFDFAVPGADGSFGVHVAITSGGTRLHLDEVGFTYGQAEVQLTLAVPGARPSAALEHGLIAILLARAKAQLG